MKKMRWTLPAILSAILALTISAQDENPIRVETNLVNINVTIVDKEGDFVEGLSQENFEIYDDEIKQDIEYFSAEDAAISYGIVYDMHPTTDERTKVVLESLRQFTAGLRDKDDFFTLVFNKRGSLILDFVPSEDQVRKHITGKMKEPNALYDAIVEATRKLRGRKNVKRVLLVITDSADHNSEHRFNDVVKEFKTLDAQLYTILWDAAEHWDYTDANNDGVYRKPRSSDASQLDRAALYELAMRTGGSTQAPSSQNARELYGIFTEIGSLTRKQYAVGFYPAKIDGGSHTLKVKLVSVRNSKKMVLTYRAGYQSIRIDD